MVTDVAGDLGLKIMLDRYAVKDMTRRSLAAGDTVIACVDTRTGQREIGTVERIDDDRAVVVVDDDETHELPLTQLDKPLETSAQEIRGRVARGIAAVEVPEAREEWQSRFEWLLDEWRFVPGGRILSAAGTDQNLTFYNCYVVPSPHDSRRGIVETLSAMMEIMSRGGGVGINVSSLRPRHAHVRGVNGRSSGAVSWGALYSFVTGLIEQGGSRRGALMLICDVWHPDVVEFINAKREAGKITNANISVGISDDFMLAVAADEYWDLVFPDVTDPDYDTQWDGDLAAWREADKPVVVHDRVRARELWQSIIESAWASAEPGVWFKDRANAVSNSWYFAPLVCTNPCGEQPLPGWSVCNLGALNLGRFVTGADTAAGATDGSGRPGGSAEVAWDELGQAVRYAVRFLDNVIDAGPYFFDENREQQLSERRVGLGTMGLAEMLVRLGHRYGSEESLAFLDDLYHFIAREAYLESASLADEKGSFPQFDTEKFLGGGFMKQMDGDVREAIASSGMRNVTLLTQAPTGTTGTMVGTSTGIEPFFSWTYRRYSRLGVHEERVAVADEWLSAHPGEQLSALPSHFVTAMELSPEEHVRVQGAIQRWVDSSISKTCNVPADYTVDQTRELYELMYRLGCKGGTVYRDQSRDEQVLEAAPQEAAAEQPPAEEEKVRPLPPKRHGMTMSKTTPVGTTHITMNDDERGQPFEVFIDIGRGGSDLKAMSEAIGRLVSLLLRMVSRLTPLERIRQIVGQLKGIGGSRSSGFGEQRTRSLPDALAQVLEEHYLDGDAPATPAGTSPGTVAAAATAAEAAGDLCPSCGHASLVHEEGCAHCRNCGHSEC